MSRSSARRSFVPGAAHVAAGLLSAIAVAPSVAGAEDAGQGDRPEVVAEALFLCDPLPPGGRDLNLALAIREGERDPATGDAGLALLPRMQLAVALGERVGFTADVGVATDGGTVFHSPGASLKLLLRPPGPGATGLAASLDLFGATHALSGSEAGLGLGAIRPLGSLALRASLSAATGVSAWSPHLHGGLSAAMALGPRWRALAEVVTEVGHGEATLAAGPTVKVSLLERVALMAGALFQLAPGNALPVFTVQLTQSL